MAELLDISAFARHRGVSRKTVYQWLAKGLISKEPNGRVDRERADQQLASEGRVATTVQREQPMEPVSLAAVGSVQETLAEAGETIGQSAPDDLGGLNGAGVTLTDARKAKTIQDTHLTRLKVQQLRGELVDRKMAESQAFAAGRLERDAWMAWPARVAAQMAADLRLESREVHTVLEQYVHEHLAELSDTQATVTG